jgi:hypothetical protein
MKDLSPDFFFFETEGFSMWPSVKKGEKLIAKKASWEDLRPGDLVIYRAQNQIVVCHRLIKKDKLKELKLYCRGDASCAGPEEISFDACLGRVVGRVKNNRYIWSDGFGARLGNRLAVFIMPIFAGFVRALMKLRRHNVTF